MMKKLLISISGLLLILGAIAYISKDQDQLGGAQDSAYVTSVEQGTTSVSTYARSIYHKEPTSTDASVPTVGTHLLWYAATTTYEGTPDKIPNFMDNQGFEYCIDANQTGQAIRFWLFNATGTDKKMGLGDTSSGNLLTAGNCWDSREYGIIYGGPVYAIASSTGGIGTSTVRYTIFK